MEHDYIIFVQLREHLNTGKRHQPNQPIVQGHTLVRDRKSVFCLPI